MRQRLPRGIAVDGGVAYCDEMADETSATTYAHPPIVEAIIELRFAETLDTSRLKRVADLLSRRYAHRLDQAHVEAKLDFPARTATFADVGFLYQLSSADQTGTFNAGLASMAWVTRAPYQGWSAFIGRVSTEAAIALKALRNPRLIRIGLRYVNRIDVPREASGLIRYEDYLKYRIDAGPLFEPCSHYQWMIRADRPETGLAVLVQSAIVAPELPGTGAFTFDIDVSTEKDVPQEIGPILDKLELMRQSKNEVFENGVTAKAKELYK